jgi:hypothetical protein
MVRSTELNISFTQVLGDANALSVHCFFTKGSEMSKHTSRSRYPMLDYHQHYQGRLDPAAAQETAPVLWKYRTWPSFCRLMYTTPKLGIQQIYQWESQGAGRGVLSALRQLIAGCLAAPRRKVRSTSDAITLPICPSKDPLLLPSNIDDSTQYSYRARISVIVVGKALQIKAKVFSL